ncbi:MAG: ABC transporter ATP-binding protein/permease [Streptococcaceae bacterium]|jgi:ABC-type bacteriocin/lantibiotic exporter with double-glycine peptidase domain|nr:ABC transporter ATP-binding protein/permease [Streptococcaceae bacterium]
MYSFKVIARFWEIKKGYVISVIFGKLKDIPRPLLSALYMKYLIDCLTQKANFWHLFSFLFLFLLFEIFFCCYDSWANIKYKSKAQEEISKTLMTKYLQTISKVPLKYFEDQEFCNKNSLATNELVETYFSLFNYCIDLITNVLSMITLAIYIFSISKIIIVTSFAIFFFYLFFNHKINQLKLEQQKDMIPIERQKGYFASLLNHYDGVKNVRVYSAENFFIDKWNENANKVIQVIQKFSRKLFIYSNFDGGIFAFFEYSITLYIAYITWLGRISVGTFSALTQSFFSFLSQMQRSSEIVINMNKCSNYFKIIEEVDSYASKKDPAEQKVFLDKNQPFEVEIKQLSFAYVNSKRKILNNLSLKVKQNEKIAIVGENGSGKSTLLHLLLRLYEPPDQTIFINGMDSKNYNLEDFRTNFAVVLQNQENYSLTVAENVFLKNSKKMDEKKVEAALKFSQLHQKIFSQKEGVSSMITKRFVNHGVALSGGENQKLNLSRFFNQEAKILILDEYERWLDHQSEKKIFENLLTFSKNKILMIITHNEKILSAMDRVYVLKNGILKERKF